MKLEISFQGKLKLYNPLNGMMKIFKNIYINIDSFPMERVTFRNLIQTGKNSQWRVNLTQAFIYGLGSSGVRGGRLCAVL